MDYKFLEQTLLFRSVSSEDLKTMLSCLGTEEKSYPKGAMICYAGDVVRSFGLVLSGRVQIESIDPWGNVSVLDSIAPGSVFAETYACLSGEPLMVNAVAAKACSILFINAARVLEVCPQACPFHLRLVRNLLSISARKNMNLSRRIFHTTPKSIRGRLSSYLSFQAAQNRSTEFTIPFNRQQLADYLGVDRSALSHELGKMQREGLLETERNHFSLRLHKSEWQAHHQIGED